MIKDICQREGILPVQFILQAQLNKVYEKARAAKPTLWAGQIRQWPYVKEFHLNPQKSREKKVKPDAKKAA